MENYLHLFKFSSSSENSEYSTTILSLLILEHNRLVEELRDINSGWSNNTLYEEAKRITIAQLQHITYFEFIPNVIGHVSKILTFWQLMQF